MLRALPHRVRSWLHRPAITYSGRLYRALNPVYARKPMSEWGAELYGGRFNPKGMPALYASTAVVPALREAN
ncbi:MULTISPECIES: RES domain-containing protein [unclassified Mesorhizobium]|uniref:RES domain-containing protein n=1 Tax=unclassified Mesorhizobium TaxID=325217 RepID=UPI002962500D|nr:MULTISPECIES: RES domain-containing protein [unclassified Mesorhizobium]